MPCGVTGDAAALVVLVWLVRKHEFEPRAALWVRASYEVDHLPCRCAVRPRGSPSARRAKGRELQPMQKVSLCAMAIVILLTHRSVPTVTNLTLDY